MQSQDNLTIDIHYNKLLDWLISRRHCKSEWRDHTLEIREKINNAIQDMPATDELTELLRGTYINYFHCLRIVELLKDTEASTKNMFGRYSSQRMKDWQEVVRLYEKDDIYLAEAAQLLSRNVSYEVPSLKKQIAKCKQTQNDATRKQSEYSSLEAETKEKFNRKCKQMGIKGDKIKRELMCLVKDLPTELNTVVEKCGFLSDALQYYTQFRQFVLDKETPDTGLLPILEHILKQGNTTVYQFLHGHAPTTVLLPESVSMEDEEEEKESETEIDWGGGIDFGPDSSTPADTIMKDINEGAIDFGETEVTDIDWGDVDLDLDINIEEGGVTVEEQVKEDTDQSGDDGTARGDLALSILDNTETRTKFTDEIYQLDAFLMMRVSELQHTGDVITAAIFDSAPSNIQLYLVDVEKMRSHTQSILNFIHQDKIQMMLSIRASTRYVDKLTENITSISNQTQKFAAMQRLMVNKRSEALDQQHQLEPKLDLIKAKTLVLKKQIEKEVSKKYKNRPVNIMGEINVM